MNAAILRLSGVRHSSWETATIAPSRAHIQRGSEWAGESVAGAYLRSRSATEDYVSGLRCDVSKVRYNLAPNWPTTPRFSQTAASSTDKLRADYTKAASYRPDRGSQITFWELV